MTEINLKLLPPGLNTVLKTVLPSTKLTEPKVRLNSAGFFQEPDLTAVSQLRNELFALLNLLANSNNLRPPRILTHQQVPILGTRVSSLAAQVCPGFTDDGGDAGER